MSICRLQDTKSINCQKTSTNPWFRLKSRRFPQFCSILIGLSQISRQRYYLIKSRSWDPRHCKCWKISSKMQLSSLSISLKTLIIELKCLILGKWQRQKASCRTETTSPRTLRTPVTDTTKNQFFSNSKTLAKKSSTAWIEPPPTEAHPRSPHQLEESNKIWRIWKLEIPHPCATPA
jgi:hypothetical protein